MEGDKNEVRVIYGDDLNVDDRSLGEFCLEISRNWNEPHLQEKLMVCPNSMSLLSESSED